MESLTQKSRRRESAHVAIAMLKAAILTACHEKQWRNGVFWSIKSVSSDVCVDLERLEESPRTTESEKAIFRETRSKVAHVRGYLEGRATDLSCVDDLGWVKRLKSVFEGQITHPRGAEKSSVGGEGGISITPPLSGEEKVDGFESQKVYGGSGGPPKG